MLRLYRKSCQRAGKYFRGTLSAIEPATVTNVVLASGADQLVRCPGLELVFVDEPADHIGGGQLQGAVKRTGEFGCEPMLTK